MKRFLICYVTAGGGHYSMAKNVKRLLENTYPQGVSVELYDVLKESSVPQLSAIYNDLYVFLTEKMPIVWKLIVKLYSIRIFARIAQITFHMCIAGKLREKLLVFEPDIVISTYYFIDPLIKATSPVPSVKIVTDVFTPHPIWFLNATQYIVFSDTAYSYATKYKAPHAQITNCGYVYNSRFDTPMSEDEIRLFKLKQRIDTEYPTILLLSGGSSLKNLDTIYKSLLHAIETKGLHTNIIVVCGKNDTLKQKITHIPTPSHAHVHIVGFTDHVYEYMNSSLCIISKAGPATVLEAVALRKYLILSSFIPDQEKGNVDFVLKHNLGTYTTEIPEVAKQAVTYTHSLVAQRTYQNNRNTLSFSNNTSTLIRHLTQHVVRSNPYSI